MPSIDEAENDLREAQDNLDAARNEAPPAFAGYTFNAKMEPNGLNEAYWQASFARTGNVIFDPVHDVFFWWETRIWERATRAEIRQRVEDHIREVTGEDSDIPFGKILKARTVMQVVERLMGERSIIRKDAFANAPDGILYVENGRIEIHDDGSHTFTEKGWRREDIQTHVLDLRYDPAAQCPQTLVWLNRVFCDRQDDVEAIQKTAGMCLWGSNDWKKILLIYGGADLGKSKILGLFRKLVGGMDRTATVDMRHMSQRFEKSRFLGKKLLLHADAPADIMTGPCGEDILELVGGREDEVRNERRYETGSASMKGTKILGFATNHLQRVKMGVNRSAWATRLLYVFADGTPYTEAEAEADFLSRYWREEGSGTLNWALCGIRILKEDGFWEMSREQTHRVQAVLDNSDSPLLWARACLREGTPDASKPGVTKDEAWASYLAWATRSNISPWPTSQGWKPMASEAILRVFAKTESHNLERGEKVEPGWRGLTLIVGPKPK